MPNDDDDPLKLLDNVCWHALSGRQAKHAAGRGRARRYAPGFSPIVAFEDVALPDFDALAPYVERDEHFYCDGWAGKAPEGWHVEAETTMFKMVWGAGPPPVEADTEFVALGPQHAARALELATLTRPGPFGPRTIELGDYVGLVDGERLVAMAGERMWAGRLREISGVCTHPDWRGRGLARRLMLVLVGRELARGELPFLHVMRDNAGARKLYETMGFRVHRESVVRVLSKA